MPEPEVIRITGARQHNLKNITVELPRNQLVVITGPSGSGKSSLAFDTLFAEGQRRYVQSLSAYARQFLDQMDKPDVDFIEGLSPAVAIEQRTSGGNPRSTIATVTEIYDYLRVLYSAIGEAHHPDTGKRLKSLTVQEIVDKVLQENPSVYFMLLAPVVMDEAGEFRDVLERLKRDGFLRARIDGELMMLDEAPRLDKGKDHTIEVVIDRLKIPEDKDELHGRLTESVELALRVGEGVLSVAWIHGPGKADEPNSLPEWKLSTENYDPETGYYFPKLTPRHFSFNSPSGACPVCHGLGTELTPDPGLVVPKPELSLEEGAIAPWKKAGPRLAGHYKSLLRDLARSSNISMETPWEDLPQEFQNLVLHGSGKKKIDLTTLKRGEMTSTKRTFEGVLTQVQTLHDKSSSETTRKRLAAFMSRQPCRSCEGRRLRREILAVTLNGRSPALGQSPWPWPGTSIHDLCEMPVAHALEYIRTITLSEHQKKIVGEVLREVKARLGFLKDVGLGYLTLQRETGTLSGGEMQRIRLATQIGAGLTGVLYILDEPSIGLHQRDNDRLIQTLVQLRDRGNSVIVVEHDEDTIRKADYVLDLGPTAGARGGYVVAKGTPSDICTNPKSPTGRFLSGNSQLSVPRKRKDRNRGWLTIFGAKEHNLKDLTVPIPLGCMTCFTGVSGSGKSTLVDDILSRALFRHFHGSKDKPGVHDRIEGMDDIDKVIVVDQTPIGRTPRSNPVTYIGAYTHIRDLFAQLPASRVRGYNAGRFSFNTAGGRCEHCKGDGLLKIEMHFLPDVYVPCDVCKGERFNRETLEITYKGHNISDVLKLTVDDALTLFRGIPQISEKLECLSRVGLGYVTLGQSATTLSGGEAQRIKLAAELSRKATGNTCYILDEPTTGLHFADIEQLLEVLFALRDSGNTVIIIEHQLDVIKSCDYIIDLGPEGGADGGNIIVTGTPEEVSECKESHTGKFLKELLQRHKEQRRKQKSKNEKQTELHEDTLL